MKRRVALVLCAVSGAACADGEPGVPEPETQCAEASARSGALECLHRIADAAAWQELSVPVDAVDQVRSTKYMLPTRPDARLRPLFMNGARHQLHLQFLVRVFPELFESLTGREYLRLLFDPAAREYLVGALTEYRTPGGASRFGFTVSGDPSATGSITCDDVRAAHAELVSRVHIAELAALPSDREQSGFFPDCGVPVLDPTQVEYEVYHRAAAFGTVRRVSARELPERIAGAELGFRDILVLDQAPSDIEAVVSGVVTGSRQAPLSHVAVRSAARGTPHCYLSDAYGYFEAWDGRLARVECAAHGLLVRAASESEAEAYWRQLKPAPVAIAPPDRHFRALTSLEALELTTAAQRAEAIGRFGAKGRNLAWLRQTLEPTLTPRGFLIPVAHYLDFVESTSWTVDLGKGPVSRTFAQTLSHWQGDAEFRGDGALRRAKLGELQAAFEAAECDPELLAELAARLVDTFGGPAVTARFRSSSNAEDGAYFNGAGLYDSLSACLADDLDDDSLGPSACDAGEANERGVCRALKRVWASLWNPKAYDEREFYGIDPELVAMGVLVNERSEAELANLVVFTGNPTARSDARFLVNAQFGEAPVVSPEPGVWPEQSLLTLEAGEVSAIERVTESSLARPGELVVADQHLRALGRELARLAASYPFDIEPPEGRSLLLDTEWKVMPDASLRVKQLRPFLK